MEKTEKYSFKIVKKIRIRIPDVPGALGKLALTLGVHGATLGDITKYRLTSQHVTRDFIVYFDNEQQLSRTLDKLHTLKGYRILLIEDEVLHLHEGGKIAITPRVSMEKLGDLRMIYTPGVAQVCNYIAAHPEAARRYTSIGNTVCIATNGSAILGLGNIGVLAGMPVMEGKSIILNKMAGISCIPLLIDSSDADLIVETLAAISPTFSAMMIEDIKAPLCFEVEEKLQSRVSVPVFHDDQHGTATVILASLIRSLHFVGKKKEYVRVVINGAGAAGMTVAKMLIEYGFKEITLCDTVGALWEGRNQNMDSYKQEISQKTNKGKEKGSLRNVISGKDIFIGLSAPQLVSHEMIKTMNKNAIVLALANPIPEIWPADAIDAGAAIAVDGRTVNNCLAFPGIMRGALDSGTSSVTYKMKFAAAEMIAELAGKHEVVPNFMNAAVHHKIAEAVKEAAANTHKI